MEKIRAILAGKKTYLTAIIAIIGALVGFANGASLSDTMQLIITAILGCTIRAAVAKK
jgi:hypothetical protein